MPSQALTTFNAAVDASALGAGAKTTAKAWGERLYLEGIKEGAEHVRFHLLAEYAQRTPSAQLTATRDFLAAVLDRVKTSSDSLALSIAAGLD